MATEFSNLVLRLPQLETIEKFDTRTLSDQVLEQISKNSKMGILSKVGNIFGDLCWQVDKYGHSTTKQHIPIYQ